MDLSHRTLAQLAQLYSEYIPNTGTTGQQKKTEAVLVVPILRHFLSVVVLATWLHDLKASPVMWNACLHLKDLFQPSFQCAPVSVLCVCVTSVTSCFEGE